MMLRIIDGLWVGLALNAIFIFVLNLNVYVELKEQRDYWKQLYCVEIQFEHDLCS